VHLCNPYSYYNGKPLIDHCEPGLLLAQLGRPWGMAMRLPIIALATALFVSILPALTSAQTGNGILDI
jgi:hypothetical protein